MKTKALICLGLILLLAGVMAPGGSAWAGAGGVPQASITLINSNAALCNANETEWSIDKKADSSTVNPPGTASWTVTVTKGATGHNFLTVNGFLGVKNTGSADATIGNIVVNLQKRTLYKGKQYWISAAADVSTAFSGDAATFANIVANASQEDPKLNALPGPGNYTVSGQAGTFTEKAGSGSLKFSLDGNTFFATIPQTIIHPGATLNLFFSAIFDATVLGISPGADVRPEVIVSFGNAGARGGSGASAPNLDISGNGQIEADEAWVRSVPTRFSLTVPPLKNSNDSIFLTDSESDITTTGTVQYSGFDDDNIDSGVTLGAGDPAGTVYTYFISAMVNSGDDGAKICNTAHLDSVDCPDCSVSVVTGYNPDGTPITHDFLCCKVIQKEASDCVTVLNPSGGGGGGFEKGDFCTYHKGQWGSQGPVGDLLASCFYTVYPPNPNIVSYPADPGGGKVEVGIPGGSGFSMIFKAAWVNTGNKNHPNYEVKPASYFVSNYLNSGVGGVADGALTNDLVNPDTSSAGQLGVEVLALELNVRFSGNSCSGTPPAGFGHLIYNNPDDSGDSLNGMTISEILAAANTALGGGALPGGYDYKSLRQLLTKLNGAFPNCNATGWAQNHLSKPTP